MSDYAPSNNILWLQDLRLSDLAQVGGKNSSLGEMIGELSGLGVSVPGGFATTADAFKDFVAHNTLHQRIFDRLASLDVEDVPALTAAGAEIRGWVIEAPLQPALERDIRDAYAKLRADNGGHEVAVAVRSSATAEDLPDASPFFQVNVPIFEQALNHIRAFLQDDSYVDMYSGVGSIGLALGGAAVLVESDPANCRMAVQNAYGTQAQVIQATAETALEYINGTHSLIVDPPRAGLHTKVVNRILTELPPKIAYLSCNPITLGRDLALLSSHYRISSLTGYNFFPRTPHIEALATLVKK